MYASLRLDRRAAASATGPRRARSASHLASRGRRAACFARAPVERPRRLSAEVATVPNAKPTTVIEVEDPPVWMSVAAASDRGALARDDEAISPAAAPRRAAARRRGCRALCIASGVAAASARASSGPQKRSRACDVAPPCPPRASSAMLRGASDGPGASAVCLGRAVRRRWPSRARGAVRCRPRRRSRARALVGAPTARWQGRRPRRLASLLPMAWPLMLASCGPRASRSRRLGGAVGALGAPRRRERPRPGRDRGAGVRVRVRRRRSRRRRTRRGIPPGAPSWTGTGSSSTRTRTCFAPPRSSGPWGG